MTAARSPRGALRLTAEARGMLPWCIALSAAGHVLLLAAVASPEVRVSGLAQAGRRSVSRIEVRLVTEARAPGERAAVMAPSTQASEPPARLSAKANPASAPAVHGEAAVAAPTGEVSSAASGAVSVSAASAETGYVPRPLLTIAPVAKAPVDIVMPSGVVEVGRRVGVLVLYIDEQGRVRRIEAEPPLLPPAMERAAREAFAAARFSPGQVDGQVVKSRIRVEVTFDAGSLPAASAASVASGASAARPASGASAARAASAASAARPASDQRSR
jgi:protein TonB